MSSNPMQRKVRNSFLLGMLISIIVVALIGVLIFFMVIQPKLNEEKEKEEQQQQQLVAYVYRLKLGYSVEAGDEITSNMVESVEIPITTVQTDFIEAQRKSSNGKLIDVPFTSGYKSKISLTEGTILTYSMLMGADEEEISDSLRYLEYNMISMPTTLEIGDYVDIRWRLSNAQDLIVISKKEIVNLYGQTIGFNLTEEEILLLNSAIVEAFSIPASELYIATYVEPGLQEAAVLTYTPTQEVIDLIYANENIVSTAKEYLIKRYNESAVRGTINGVTSQYEGDKKYNIEAGIQEQIEAARQARESYLSSISGY